MMRTILMCTGIFLIGSYGFTQKKLVTHESYKTWQSLKEIAYNVSSLISNDGKYMAYRYGAPVTGDVVVIQSIDGNYKKEFKVGPVFEPSFTADNRRFILMLPGDSLAILLSGTNKINYIGDIVSYAVPASGIGKWLAFTNKKNELTVMDMDSRAEKKYSGVEEYKFDPGGSVLLIKTTDRLIWRDLPAQKDIVLASGIKILTVAFDASGKQLGFVTNNNDTLEIRYYKPRMDSACVLADDQTAGLGKNLEIADGNISFSADGTKCFFELREKSSQTATHSEYITDEVEVWHYRSPFIPADELARQKRPETYLAVCHINRRKVVRLTDANTQYLNYYDNNNRGNQYILANTRDASDEADFHWNKHIKSLYLVSVENGSTKEISRFIGSFSEFMLLSPDEKFVVWFDEKDHQYHSYETATGMKRNISAGINAVLYDDESEIINRRRAFGAAAWVNDGSLLVYDRFDIWKIDPGGKKKPVCITGGIGQKEKIVFRRLAEDEKLFKEIAVTDTLGIAALDTRNKDNGFWKVTLQENPVLTKCTMGAYAYYFPRRSRNILIAVSEYLPVKSKDANVYIVRRMNFNESPNLYFTRDFKRFTPLTDLRPEKEYNWLSGQLVTWQIPNSKMSSGILYKPENFDSSKRYPVIFYYYEKLSDGLHVYPSPEPSIGTLSIPWYVSNGYLVFVPDIYYERGKVWQSVVSSITSAVDRLARFSWINTSKMGLQGHSFGGFETLSIIAHTKIFAAAQESAGYTNAVSYYNQRTGMISNRNQYFDIEQGNLGFSPWENPQIFIDQSPIFHVNHMSTPLLIMHNKGDDNVDFHQAVELFISLRRLGKPSWFVQYKDENHTIRRNPENQLDFTIRQQQFFDHFLKGKPAPRWMKEPDYQGID